MSSRIVLAVAVVVLTVVGTERIVSASTSWERVTGPLYIATALAGLYRLFFMRDRKDE